MNGFAALDTAAVRCSTVNKRSVTAPSPAYRHTASFCQKRICEKLLTVPNHKAFNERISVLADDNHTKIHIVLEKLVGQLNITYEALKKWKQGGNAPSDLEYVEKLAECIGMDPSELLIPLEEGIIMKKYAPTKDSEIIQSVF